MFSQPSIFGSMLEKLEFNVLSIIVFAFPTCKKLSNEFTTTEMFVQQRSLGFLDLALDTPRTTSWKIYAKNIVHGCFPSLTREYFLAEKVALRQKLSELYDEVIKYNEDRLKNFEEKHDRFICGLIPPFEGKLFHRFSSKGNDEKRRILYKYLKAYKILNVDRFSIRYAFLMEHCTKPPLDCELTVHMLKTVCDSDHRKVDVLSAPLDEASLETLICHASDMRFDFWGMWRENTYLRHKFDFVANFLYSRSKPQYAIIFLKYGFPYLACDEGFSKRWSRLPCVKPRRMQLIRPTLQLPYEQPIYSNQTRRMLIVDTFTIFGDFKSRGNKEDYVLTLLHLTRTLPEPYVTPYELVSTMKAVMKPEFLILLVAIAKKYSETDIFESEHTTHLPRMLMHLCRVVIRNRLGVNFKLPHGIDELNFPESITSYLKLER